MTVGWLARSENVDGWNADSLKFSFKFSFGFHVARASATSAVIARHCVLCWVSGEVEL